MVVSMSAIILVLLMIILRQRASINFYKKFCGLLVKQSLLQESWANRTKNKENYKQFWLGYNVGKRIAGKANK